jgi:hypothetical protein
MDHHVDVISEALLNVDQCEVDKLLINQEAIVTSQRQPMPHFTRLATCAHYPLQVQMRQAVYLEGEGYAECALGIGMKL